MKSPTKVFLPVFALLVSSCSFVKTLEEDLTYRVMVDEEVVQTGTINIFNNAVLPAVADKKGETLFYKWYLGNDNPDLKQDDRLLPEEGLLRYNDCLKFAVDNVLTVKAVYLSSEDFPSPYLTVRWYARTNTSGLDDATIENWKPSLMSYLASIGASEEDLADVDIKGYAGAVADFGAAVNKDKVVDVLVGVGNNIDSTGGVSIKEKAGNIPMNGKSRYVARLTDKPIAISVYQWLQTEAGYAGLTVE